MNKQRYRWWGYMKAVIRAYPDLRKEFDALHEASVSANISGMPGGGGLSRSTENVALRQLSRQDQREMEAVEKAIAITKRMRTGEVRLRLIELVFFKKTKLKDAAELVVYISYDTAVGYHTDFIMLTAYFLGKIDADELNDRLRYALKIGKCVV